MKKRSFLLASGVLCSVCASIQAAEVPVPQCPNQLAVQQINKSAVDYGWKPVDSNERHNLEEISFSYGEYPVQQTGFLISSGQKKLLKGSTVVYYDDVPSDTEDGWGHWIACKYSGSAVVLVQKLPEKVVRCEVTIDVKKDAGRNSVKCCDTPRKMK